MAVAKSAGKILILATESCAYPGADAVGQGHQSYPANTYILRVRAPVLFTEKFYLDCFDKGIAGIIIMSCGWSALTRGPMRPWPSGSTGSTS